LFADGPYRRAGAGPVVSIRRACRCSMPAGRPHQGRGETTRLRRAVPGAGRRDETGSGNREDL